jgi:hypothetical protein
MQSSFLCAFGCVVSNVKTCSLHVTRAVLLALTRSPFIGLDKPVGLHEVEVPRISRQLAQGGGKVVSRTHRPPLRPRRYWRYSFLLAVVSTPGPQCGRMKIPKDPSGNGTHDLPSCSAVRQPNVPPRTGSNVNKTLHFAPQCIHAYLIVITINSGYFQTVYPLVSFMDKCWVSGAVET